MRIRVKGETARFGLVLPTGLVLNRLTVYILWEIARKENGGEPIPITPKQAVRLMQEIKRYKKHHPDWILVEVEKSDGGSVLVKP